MKYYIHAHEVWVQKIAVVADSPEEALQKVLDGDGDYLDDALVYSCPRENSAEWVVEVANPG